MKKLAPLLIIMAGILWGTIGIFVRTLSAAGLNSLQIAEIRSIITALVLLLFLLFYDRSRLRIRLSDCWMFAGSGLLSITFFNFCYFTAITLTSLSIAAILLYTAPVFVMLMSVLFFREKVTRTKIAALLSSFIGCVLVSGIFTDGGTSLTPAGLLIGLGAGFGYALYSIFGTFALRSYHPLTMTAYSFFFAAIGSLPVSGIPDAVRLISGRPSLLLPCLLLGLISGLFAYLLYTFGLNYVPASQASIMASVEPVAATVIGILIFGENPDVFCLCGIICVLASIIILNFSPHTKKG